MFHGRKIKHRTNSILKGDLKLVYEDSYDLTFRELLATDKSVSIYQKTQVLSTEIFKSKTGVSLN